ncbi:MAG: hypothetical protein LBP99_09325 [Azoarcus sp.]|jgi:tetratricopeptide (TPR) repeat protein|nr:hypothetical protein [Azoarcus sp.]
MSFLKKIFKSKAGQSASPTPQDNTQTDPSKDPNMVRIHDTYGREMFITKQAWRDSVLMGNLEKEKNNPDALYSIIIMSLQDGFSTEVLPYAKHLSTIDTNPERGYITYAVTLLQLKQYDDAEKVLLQLISKYGETGTALTNLAKVYAGQGNDARAFETLWRSLALDPNQDNGLLWYQAICREKDGERGSIEAFQKIAALPGSWRAQIWLARNRLEQHDLPSALALYNQALSAAPHPVPGDLLQQISGDLGNNGHLFEILQLVASHYDPRTHGLAVGNNLIKAHFDLDHLDTAQEIVESLYEQKRPDWNQTLSYWTNEIAKKRVSSANKTSPPDFELTILSLAGPVWLPTKSAASKLFPAKLAGAPVIAFMAGTVEVDASEKTVQHQLTSDAGRISRAIPLYLAERIEFSTTVTTRTLFPYVVKPSPAFALMGTRIEDQAAAEYARQDECIADYIVTTHLLKSTPPWTIELRLIRTIDACCVMETQSNFETDAQRTATSASACLEKFENALRVYFASGTSIASIQTPVAYQPPPTSSLPAYLVCSEQLLAIRAATMHKGQRTLYAERDILTGQLQLCAQLPHNIPARLILFQALAYLNEICPHIVSEFKERVNTLQKEKPLPPAQQSIFDGLFSSLFP